MGQRYGISLEALGISLTPGELTMKRKTTLTEYVDHATANTLPATVEVISGKKQLKCNGYTVGAFTTAETPNEANRADIVAPDGTVIGSMYYSTLSYPNTPCLPDCSIQLHINHSTAMQWTIGDSIRTMQIRLHC